MPILTPFLRVFRAPSVASVVQRELEEAELALLQAQSQMEYASAMLIYHTTRVARLRKVHFARAGSETQLRAVL